MENLMFCAVSKAIVKPSLVKPAKVSSGKNYSNRSNKNVESIHQVNKQTLHHQSINQMVIR